MSTESKSFSPLSFSPLAYDLEPSNIMRYVMRRPARWAELVRAVYGLPTCAVVEVDIASLGVTIHAAKAAVRQSAYQIAGAGWLQITSIDERLFLGRRESPGTLPDVAGTTWRNFALRRSDKENFALLVEAFDDSRDKWAHVEIWQDRLWIPRDLRKMTVVEAHEEIMQLCRWNRSPKPARAVLRTPWSSVDPMWWIKSKYHTKPPKMGVAYSVIEVAMRMHSKGVPPTLLHGTTPMDLRQEVQRMAGHYSLTLAEYTPKQSPDLELMGQWGVWSFEPIQNAEARASDAHTYPPMADVVLEYSKDNWALLRERFLRALDVAMEGEGI